jgi:5-formyltetrahydrofolate cyclo-ligase
MQHQDADGDAKLEQMALRAKLIAAREGLPDRLERAVQLQSVLRAWLVGRAESSIGAYWPIKGEFDPLPALFRWTEGVDEAHARIIGLPVVDKASKSLNFHMWFPGCPMEPDAYDIPKPKGTPVFRPQMLLLPCLGYGPGGMRVGYGGGFCARTIAGLSPRPAVIGVGYSIGFQPLLRPDAHSLQLDAMLTEDGVMWQRPQ